MKRRFTLTLLAAASLMLVGPALLRAEEAPDAPESDKPVLSGPEADHDAGHGRKFDGKPMDRPDGGLAEMFHKILADLNLTDDQKAQVKAIVDKSTEEAKAYREAHEDEFTSIREQLKAARQAKDQEKAEAAMKQLKELHDNAPVGQGKVAAKIRPVLTPEQQTTFDAKIAEIKVKMEERRKEMQDKRPGHRDGDKKAGDGHRRHRGDKDGDKGDAGDDAGGDE